MLYSQFGAITEDVDGLGVDPRAVKGDTILHGVCSIIDSRKWVFPDEMVLSVFNVIFDFSSTFDVIFRIYHKY